MKLGLRNRYTGVMLIGFILNVLLLLTVLAGPAAATPYVWTLSDVSTVYGNSLTGWFVYDAALYPANGVSDWSLILAPPTAGTSGIFTPTTGDGAASGSLFYWDGIPATIPHYGGSYIKIIIDLTGPLTPPGPGFIDLRDSAYLTFNGLSYAEVPFASGQFTYAGVPEPSTLLLLSVGLSGLLVWGRKKFKYIQSVGAR